MLHLISKESLKSPGIKNEKLDSEIDGNDQARLLSFLVKAKPIATFLTF